MARVLFRRCASQLTAEAYNVERGAFGKLEKSDFEFFKSIGAGLVTNKEDLEAYNEDWMKKYTGKSQLMLKPTSTGQVSEILKHCNERKLAVVPQGGNTGLVGGSVPVFDEIILNLQSMNKIRSFDALSGVITVDAGVVLETADEYLRDKGYLFPLDLGAKGSCQIGGNVSTNAGGLRLLRYGSLHGNVLGVEAVLPDGRIFDGLSTLRKDNTGYDLKQLFVGAEGTLGIVTGVSVLCPPKPSSVNVAWLGLESFEKVPELFRKSRGFLGEILSAFECMDAASLNLTTSLREDLNSPLEESYPFAVLIETSGSNQEHDDAKIQEFLEDIMGNEIVADGVLASDATQIGQLWALREGISEASGAQGGVYKYDVSLPLAEMWKLVDAVRQRLKSKGLLGETSDMPAIDVIGYGHIGDCNLHLNIPVRRYDHDVEAALEPYVFEFVAENSGSISAEHGVGFQKSRDVEYSRSTIQIELMEQIRRQFDPNGIMNPYKFVQ